MHLQNILNKYKAQDLAKHSIEIAKLHRILTTWASTCLVDILIAGSRAKGTAIRLSSDVDYLVSLKSDCNQNQGGLKRIYDSLYETLKLEYSTIRKQNVSFQLNLSGLTVDVTPARLHEGTTDYHSLYVSKLDTWKQTNINIHFNNIYYSGFRNEIKLIKIWRELNNLVFPSIYLEYLVIEILINRKFSYGLESNFLFILNEFARSSQNPLTMRVVDPSNSNNILSDLLNQAEMNSIVKAAIKSVSQRFLSDIIW